MNKTISRQSTRASAKSTIETSIEPKPELVGNWETSRIQTGETALESWENQPQAASRMNQFSR
jgi:hypothetical protein